MSEPVPPQTSATWPFFRWVAASCAFLAAYYLLARLSQQTAMLAGCVGLLSLQAGLAVAIVYRFGRSFAAMVFLASFLALLPVQQWPVALGLAAGNACATLLCVMILRSRPFSAEFLRTSDANRFLAAIGLSTLVSALNGAVWLWGAGRIDASQIASAVGLSYLGDFAGIICLSPLLLATPITRATLESRRFLQSTVCLVLLLAIIAFVPLSSVSLLLAFLPFLFIVRTAAIHGLAAAWLHFLVLLIFVLIAQITGTGPAEYMAPGARPFGAWGFLTALGLTIFYTTGLIGERESVERRLLTGEENYKALIEDNPALIGRFSLEGRIAFANETFRRIFGIHKGMTAGANFYELTGTHSDARFLEALQTMRVGDPAVTSECVVVLESENRWIRWTARVVGESSGMGIEFHAVGLEVTEQKKAEADRRRIEAQAVQAQKLESVGMIAGGIAHEFNNILTAVLGNLELARMTLPENSESAPHLDEVQFGARRAAELTQQLLSYAGRRVLPPAPLDLSEVIRATVDLFSVAVPKSCEVIVELAEGLPLIAADEVRLRQLLMSLMANAGEAVCETGGSVSLRVRTVNVDPKAIGHWRLKGVLDSGVHVLLQVEDRGIGMSPPVLARIFEPFFSARFPGRGLGLAAALGIAREYSGAIGVCSRPGLGTCVSVLFPTLDGCTAGLSSEPIHSPDCHYCRNQEHSQIETPAEGHVPLPPALCISTARTGWSSSVRGRAAKFKAHEV